MATKNLEAILYYLDSDIKRSYFYEDSPKTSISKEIEIT